MSYAKIFLILYPPLENSTIRIAILTTVQPAAILHPNLSHFSKEGALRGVVVMLSKLHVIVGTIFILFQVTHNQFDKRVCKKSVDVHYIVH